jgi:hypothetical protein
VKEKHHSTLTVETGLQYINKQFQSIASVDAMRMELSKADQERIGKGLESNSSKDKQTLDAIAFVADSLTHPSEREYIFTYAVSFDFALLPLLTERFSFDKMRYHILKADAGYNTFLETHKETLALAGVSIRVRDFLTYLHYIDQGSAGELVKKVTHAVGRKNLKDEFSFAYHLEHQPELPNGLRAVGRNIINDYLNEAAQFVGQEIGQGELIRHLRDKFDAETGAITSERELLRLLKCAFEVETSRGRKEGKRTYRIRLIQRKTLQMVLSKYDLSRNPLGKCNNNTSQAGVLGQLCDRIHASNGLKAKITVETVPITPLYGVQTSVFGYWSPEMTEKGWQKR